MLFIALTASARTAELPETELLLSGGMLYSLTQHTYKAPHLPNGWSIAAAGYSPDQQMLAIIVTGVPVPQPVAPAKRLPLPPVGPINKTIRAWRPSTHLILVDRASGAVLRAWLLAAPAGFAGDWTLAWTLPTEIDAAVHFSTATPADLLFKLNIAGTVSTVKPEPGVAPSEHSIPTNDCHGTLTETQFQGNVLRFIKDAATCSTPPETSDVYQLVQPHEGAKEKILWEYRVPTDQTSCAEPYACYTGSDAQFLSVDEHRFLVWDGDFFTIQETENGIEAQLVTQLLPQFSHPLGIAAKHTVLNPLDWDSAMPFQPVNEALRLPHSDSPQLVAQNFLPTRSFNATIDIGPYQKSVMVPAGTQVGPVDIGSFKDSAYTPVLSSVRWTSFHHRADPVYCKLPYTVSANTAGMIVSIKEDKNGGLECQIQFQEDR